MNSCEALKMTNFNFGVLSTFCASSQESTLKGLSATLIFKQISEQNTLCKYKEWLGSTVFQKF